MRGSQPHIPGSWLFGPPARGHLVWIKLLQRVGTYKQASKINLIVVLKPELRLFFSGDKHFLSVSVEAGLPHISVT